MEGAQVPDTSEYGTLVDMAEGEAEPGLGEQEQVRGNVVWEDEGDEGDRRIPDMVGGNPQCVDHGDL